MVSHRLIQPRLLTLYLAAWLAYMTFAVLAYPVFNISVLLLSVALAMLGAWYYGFAGAFYTIVLTIPFHSLLLAYYTSHESALNPFGISTQVLASITIALLRNARKRLEELNETLEKRVAERTRELEQLHNYIIRNHESAQIVLSNILLCDIGLSLNKMLQKCDQILTHLMFEGKVESSQASHLTDMIKESIDIVENLEFIDHFFSDETSGFIEAIEEVKNHFQNTIGVRFDVEIDARQHTIPKFIQHQLYRITQEAITNAVRHGNASRISIELSIMQVHYCLSVTNDGLPLPAKIESGLGLKLMRHRTQQLGGSLSYRTMVDGRTELYCTIPCSTD